MRKGPPRITFSYTVSAHSPQISTGEVRQYVLRALSSDEISQRLSAGATLTIGDDETHTCPLRDSGHTAQRFPLLVCHSGEYYLLMNAGSMRGVIELSPGDERLLTEKALSDIGSPIDKAYRDSHLPHMTDKLYAIHLAEGACGVITVGRGTICFSITNTWSQVPLETFIPKDAVPPTLHAQRKHRDNLIEQDKGSARSMEAVGSMGTTVPTGIN